MPVSGPIPSWVLSIVAAATLFTVMLSLGLDIVVGEFRGFWRHPGLVVKALFAVLVAVPAVALIASRALDLPRSVEIGIVLMAISPGAPVALRRSLSAGGHRAFAPALQISLAVLAVVSMPLSVAVLNHYYQGHAAIQPRTWRARSSWRSCCRFHSAPLPARRARKPPPGSRHGWRNLGRPSS